MIFLIDHNLKGHALVFFGAIASQGWLDFVPIQFVTIDNADRLLNGSDYRGRCVESLIEIVLDIDSYRGARRLFIPSSA
ncbi:hypothetical protein IQ249_20440 [Lusitaniella coriacea LEGE 07157]|uniref:DUF5615 domain-containing protein n=1 Tax=Lusitaniella coriacea LEGE 07157 TaxID=945747 RepID=A0A8J7J5U7_9CYAN|nr:hypothetical protein [Lusitaniella coriacea]MBE9118264.1 hypothetical protein [Lusitaniella coriacea LEGE 07157]